MAVKLRAERREENGKGAARKLRARGRVPAVLYGKGTETVALSVDAHEAEYLFQSISVENTIVDLEVDGERSPVQTLVREIQVHPYRPVMLHVDFYRVRAGEMIELDIPVHTVGTPEGVKNSGGVLQLVIHELPVWCLPTQIPESIEVDVSALDVGDAIHVADIAFPEGVEAMAEGDRTVCLVAAPRVAEASGDEDGAAPDETASEGADGEG